ncbi:PREDICTED: putative Ras-related protein Rab-33 [Nicrophorus vespilloides]|uniref:Ras-related protein Rab-33 n=1 Tax=Nicrophorus vespilloides TaxID=110193 RepID=A0ABM1MXG0_NICVS|nr:PREDICTED: putative Ras-related protein Rab-33 [Nicrophorus vespilloides]
MTDRIGYKVIVVGDPNVGKTSLTYRFCEGLPLGHSIITVGVDLRLKMILLDDQLVTLQIWDTAGMERHDSMVQSYYRKAHAVVIMYDVTNRQSFDNLQYWLTECGRFASSDIVKVMVGNKCEEGAVRAVSKSEAQRFADDNEMPLFETSAKLESEVENIETIFRTIAHKLLHERNIRISDCVILQERPMEDELANCVC